MIETVKNFLAIVGAFTLVTGICMMILAYINARRDRKNAVKSVKKILTLDELKSKWHRKPVNQH